MFDNRAHIQRRYEDPPIKADKGKYLGSCNRRACQKPGADWYNSATRAYYCEECATKIDYEYFAFTAMQRLCSKGEHKVS